MKKEEKKVVRKNKRPNSQKIVAFALVIIMILPFLVSAIAMFL